MSINNSKLNTDQDRAKLSSSPWTNYLLVLWAGGGTFIAYCLVYVLRKSFAASTFEGYELWGLEYKQIIIISQFVGALVSKICGIKTISELKPKHRLRNIIVVSVGAQISLIFFGLIPYPYNFACLFFNGLCLGYMWGFLFSYIEGRRLTEVLASALAVSTIVGSGAARSLGAYFLSIDINPFWMPALAGAVALPLLIGVSFLLNKLPAPTNEENATRMKRVPLDQKQRKSILKQHAAILIPLLIISIVGSALRDVKEDFLMNIIGNLNINLTPSMFLKIDLTLSLFVLALFGSMILIKDRKRTLYILLTLMLIGSVLLFVTSLMFNLFPLYPIVWLLLHNLGLYTIYLVFSTILFERLIIFYEISGNVGFFTYLANSFSYFVSCIFLLGKTCYSVDIDWSQYYYILSTNIGLLCIILTSLAICILKFKKRSIHEN